MKSLKFTFVLALLTMAVSTFAQDKKKASPPETATGKIGNATVTINYSAPSAKGREIWGKLVPYGEVWRAGANEATTFESDKDLTVEGKLLPAGKYALFVIPEKDNTATVIFNTEPKQWGAYSYKKEKDQLRVNVNAVSAGAKTEKLTYTIVPTGFSIAWDNLTIPVTVK